MSFEWTDKNVKTLTQLWADGASGSEIAYLLGRGCTRNAVIGKIHRLRLPKRSGPDAESHRLFSKLHRKRQLKTVAQRYGLGQAGHIAPQAAKRAVRVPLPPPEAPTASAVKFEDLSSEHCRFPYDTPNGRVFCGCEKVPGSSWCASHRARVYITEPIRPRKMEFEKDVRQVTFYELVKEGA